MKKLILGSILVLLGTNLMASTNYWPNNTNMLPQPKGEAFGEAAYVVGETTANVKGSLAIGDGDGVAYVNNVTNAVQIGAGANTVAGTMKNRNMYVLRLLAIDTETTTVMTNYVAYGPGDVVIGKAGSTNKIWIAKGSGTNNWVSKD